MAEKKNAVSEVRAEAEQARLKEEERLTTIRESRKKKAAALARNAVKAAKATARMVDPIFGQKRWVHLNFFAPLNDWPKHDNEEGYENRSLAEIVVKLLEAEGFRVVSTGWLNPSVNHGPLKPENLSTADPRCGYGALLTW